MKNINFLDTLNQSQRTAVETTEGYIRLTAGAGSGKTRALVSRYLYLAEIYGIHPDNILCITFTRKAADEMKKRIYQVSSINLEGSLISTYHGFCYKVIREDAHRLHIKKDFDIIDDNKLENFFRDIYKELKLTIKNGELKKLKEALFIYKIYTPYVEKMTGLSQYTYAENVLNFNHELQQILSNKNYRYLAEEISRYSSVIGHYLARQIEYACYDFFDLLEFTLYLFGTDNYVLEKWQNRLEYIMVDEFQDSSPKENLLISYLAGQHHNLFVVGDPDQSIYSFKGGDISVFLNFNKFYPNVIDLQLYENYRSTQQIVELSNQLIAKNKKRIDKSSIPKRGRGKEITHFHCKKDKQEMQFLVNEIQEIIQQGEYSWKNIAIIVRSHRSKKPIEAALVKAGFPYTIADGIKFYARKEIQTALAYIRMLHSDCNESFLKSIKEPKRGVGERLLDKIKRTADLKLCSFYQALKYLQEANNLDFNKTTAGDYIEVIDFLRTREMPKLSTQVHDILRASGYLDYLRQGANEQRIINVEDLIDSVLQLEIRRQQDVSLKEYLNIIHEQTRVAEEDEEKDEIQIMTIHSSKGLEFKVVFLPHFNDGILPNAKSLADIDKLEEDRRLAYVAVTRAEDILYITESEGLGERGSTKMPSRFLFDFDRNMVFTPNAIPEKYVEQWQNNFSTTANNHLADNELKIGEQIKHIGFGIGIIQAVTDTSYMIQFKNPPKIRNISKSYQFEKITNLIKPEQDQKEVINPVGAIQTTSVTLHTIQLVSTEEPPIISISTDPLEQIKPILPMEETPSHQKAVQHPLWGIGFIIEMTQNETHYLIRFPEISENREIPKDTLALKFCN